MKNFSDLTGLKFERLTVIERVENDKRGAARWRCKCICGGETITSSAHLKSGHTKSCGCYSKEVAKIKLTKTNIFISMGYLVIKIMLEYLTY